MTDSQARLNDSMNDGYGVWGDIFQKAVEHHPEARFVLHSGDLVDDGDLQMHWEYFFQGC